MRLRGRVLGGAAVVLSLFAPLAPARALPAGPPAIEFIAIRDEPSLTYDLIAVARDPDGLVIELSVCVDATCASTEQEPDVARGALACVQGDERSVSLRHAFAEPGTYDVEVRAVGAGCPVVGSTDEVVEVHDVEVPVPPPPPGPIPCAQEGEPAATAPGVDAERIVAGALVELSGVGAPFEGGAAIGIHAATHAIERAGGVCGRTLEVRMRDTGGDEQRHRQFARAMMESGEVFAMVATSPEGLYEDIAAHAFPFVGTAGDPVEEFEQALVWATGTGNHAFGRVAVEEAYVLGARTFGLVYDQSATFGTETAAAVRDAVAARGDAVLVADEGVLPARASYGAEIQRFNQGCGGVCDAVIVALDPRSALTWMAGAPQQGTLRTSLHPVAFSTAYASNCGAVCSGQVLWTGHQPPIGSAPGAARMCEDVRWISPTADCANPHTIAAYEAVFLAAYGMGSAGVDLTRPGFAAALDAQSFDIGLHGGPLSYMPSRFANRWLRGYGIVIAQGSFAGLRDETGWIEDPN